MMVVCLILLAALSAAAAQSLPGCLPKCGELEIPYPFGVGVQPGTGKSCFLEETFNVTCQNSQLMFGNVEISNISLLQGQMDMSMFVSWTCFNESGGVVDGIISSLKTLSFTISSSENKFFTVGCDSYGFLRSFQNNRSSATGCLTQCDGVPNEENSKTCSGIGCCQVDIPLGMRNISMEAYTFNVPLDVSNFNNCSYAFAAKRDWFKYSNKYLEYFPFDKVPLVVDWAVSNGTCKSAQGNPDYACTSNTDCEDTDDGVGGYRCKCEPGFDGNPYHPDGCHDVDECKEPSQSIRRHNCISNENCLNRNGSFDCYCPSGYSGNGTREGGCHANNPLTKILIGVFSSLGSIVFLIGISLLYKLFNKRRIQKRKDKNFKQNGGLLLQQRLSSGEINFDKTKLFNLKDLENATDHFNVNRVLGKGGQGTVYKGMLTDGKIVAVKNYKVQGNVDEFINEVVILSQVNHKHVVKLLGFCLETKVPLLVYEFIPNGNLFQYLHDRNEENIPMTWEMRLRIATEVAGALFYLHSAASQPIYHRDIKSTNILLDEKYRAKVADFGTRMVTIEDTHLTTLVQGTFGYLDPEYFHTSQFTEKSDVYSFGVVLVELLTGQKPISSIRPEEAKSLASYFIMNMEEDRVFDVLDRRIMEGGEKEEIMAVANLARRCLELNGRKRPTMKEVTIQLEGIQKWGKRYDIVEQSHEEIKVFGIEANQQWGANSTSIESTLNSRTSSSSVVLSLLSNK